MTHPRQRGHAHGVRIGRGTSADVCQHCAGCRNTPLLAPARLGHGWARVTMPTFPVIRCTRTVVFSTGLHTCFLELQTVSSPSFIFTVNQGNLKGSLKTHHFYKSMPNPGGRRGIMLFSIILSPRMLDEEDCSHSVHKHVCTHTPPSIALGTRVHGCRSV